MFATIWFVLAAASAFVFGLAGLMMKASQARGGSTPHLLAGMYLSGTFFFVLHTTLAGHWTGLGLAWLLMGLLIGSGSAWGNDVFMKALNVGPASLTSPLTNMNIVLVVFMGIVWFDESLSIWQGVAIICLLTAVFMLAYRKPEQDTNRQLPWIWFGLTGLGILLFAIRNGGLKIAMELGLSNDSVLALAYAWSLLWFLPPAMRKTVPISQPDPSQKKGWLWGIGTGVCSYGGMQLYALALEYGNVNVVAPVFATNSLIIALGSMLFFHERLRTSQLAALALIIFGLIAIRWT